MYIFSKIQVFEEQPCADPESYVRGGPTLIFYWWDLHLVTCKQFDPGQTQETQADLYPNHLTLVTGIKTWDQAFSLSFPRFAVCQTWRTLQTQARCCIMQCLVEL